MFKGSRIEFVNNIFDNLSDSFELFILYESITIFLEFNPVKSINPSSLNK